MTDELRKNPIPFDSNDMSLRQIKYCVEILRDVFNMLDNNAHDEQIVSYIRRERRNMRERYSNEN